MNGTPATGTSIHADRAHEPATGARPGSMARPLRAWVVALAATGFIAIAGFEVALALGAPLGRAAWGGTYVHLPLGLRIGSGFAAVACILAALMVLGRAKYRVSPVPFRVSRYGTWVLVGALAVGAVMNFASSSNWERFLMGPLALLLALLSLVIARSDVEGGSLPVAVITAESGGNPELGEELAGLSDTGRHIIAEGSGHYVQYERPQIVVDAILDVVESARTER